VRAQMSSLGLTADIANVGLGLIFVRISDADQLNKHYNVVFT